MEDSKENQGIYLNGRNQVIELLKNLSGGEKNKLLKNIKNKNPQMARELAESCMNFESLWNLNSATLKIILSQVSPVIIGLAISISSPKEQKIILSLMSRDAAMRAFEIMQKDLSANRSECLKAREKILEVAINQYKNKLIELY